MTVIDFLVAGIRRASVTSAAASTSRSSRQGINFLVHHLAQLLSWHTSSGTCSMITGEETGFLGHEGLAEFNQAISCMDKL